MSEIKEVNPKDLQGMKKIPYHLWPATATMLGCVGMLDGAGKYGRSNYRAMGVKASIYVDACKRHLDAWFEGEEVAPDSRVPHLGHALACIAIIIDARAAGKLIDDRMFQGGYLELAEELNKLVPIITAKHADKTPHHFTIADNDVK